MTLHYYSAFVAALFLAFFPNVLHVHGRWVNSYDQSFSFSCGSRYFIRGIISNYHDEYEDRRFFLTCGKLPSNLLSTRVSCHWSGYVNGFEEGQMYRCGDAGYIAGLASYHDNRKEDRRFRFYCCQMQRTKTFGCYNTGYVNGWTDDAAYVVPDGKILKGMSSYHDKKHDDRRYKYEVCSIARQ